MSGAVYVTVCPVPETLPPESLHDTAIFVLPVTEAVKLLVPPAVNEAELGLSETATASPAVSSPRIDTAEHPINPWVATANDNINKRK